MRKFKVKYEVLNNSFETFIVGSNLSDVLIKFALRYKFCRVKEVFVGNSKIYEDVRLKRPLPHLSNN